MMKTVLKYLKIKVEVVLYWYFPSLLNVLREVL